LLPSSPFLQLEVLLSTYWSPPEHGSAYVKKSIRLENENKYTI